MEVYPRTPGYRDKDTQNKELVANKGLVMSPTRTGRNSPASPCTLQWSAPGGRCCCLPGCSPWNMCSKKLANCAAASWQNSRIAKIARYLDMPPACINPLAWRGESDRARKQTRCAQLRSGVSGRGCHKLRDPRLNLIKRGQRNTDAFDQMLSTQGPGFYGVCPLG